MSRLQVLVATMHRNDFSIYQKMNLQSDAIIANQNGENSVATERINGHSITMLSTDTIGIGYNRNVALLAADADVLLFADDDIIYYDGYADAVLRAFEEQPKADMMVFGIDFTKNDAVYKRRNVKNGRIRMKALRYGACVLAVKRKSLLRANVCFSLLFGGGCSFSCGEDSLFLVDCLRRGLKLYGNSFVLGKCAKDSSSWFEGFGEKYYYDKGAWISAAFPRTKHLLKWYFWLKQKRKTDLPAGKVLNLMNRGIRGFRMQKPFSGAPENEAKE